jgi:phage virion morphogenesis protein
MSLEFSIDTADINSLIDKTLAFGKTGALMERLGRVMLTDVDMNFRRGVSPDGTPWAPLKHRQGQPLRDTKRLQNSMTYSASNDEVTVGTNVIYAPTHQFGATIKPKKGKFLVFKLGDKTVFAKQVTIPARPFIGIGEIQVRKINREIDRWAEEIIDGN